jgi:hypothetical protein
VLAVVVVTVEILSKPPDAIPFDQYARHSLTALATRVASGRYDFSSL